MLKKKIYCPQCGQKLSRKLEENTMRDYCISCQNYFYDNPLPVASSIVVIDQKLLLVKRKNEPRKGEWCLPSGFAEVGETIQEAALRELNEEAGVIGEIDQLISVDSAVSELYGDVLFVTFEVKMTGGKVEAGDDAEEVQLFPFNEIPPLAFSSNVNTLNKYFQDNKEYRNLEIVLSLSKR